MRVYGNFKMSDSDLTFIESCKNKIDKEEMKNQRIPEKGIVRHQFMKFICNTAFRKYEAKKSQPGSYINAINNLFENHLTQKLLKK